MIIGRLKVIKGLYFVINGEVSISHSEIPETNLVKYKEGAFFGESFLIQQKSLRTYKAKSKLVNCLFLGADKIREFLKDTCTEQIKERLLNIAIFRRSINQVEQDKFEDLTRLILSRNISYYEQSATKLLLDRQIRNQYEYLIELNITNVRYYGKSLRGLEKRRLAYQLGRFIKKKLKKEKLRILDLKQLLSDLGPCVGEKIVGPQFGNLRLRSRRRRKGILPSKTGEDRARKRHQTQKIEKKVFFKQ